MKIITNNTCDINVSIIFENENYNSELLNYLEDKKLFDRKLGSVYCDTGYKASNTILLGLGDKNELTDEKLRLAGYKLVKSAETNKVPNFTLELPNIPNLSVTKSIVEGIYQATYKFDKFISDKKESVLNTVYLKNANESELEEAKILIDGIFFARELINEPAMYMYPETLANITYDKLESVGVKVTVYDKKEIEKLNMKAFLAVSEGSDKEPKFIVMEYIGDKHSNNSIAFVGKGLTYDSGGYCIKPPASMSTMHADMGGAATVIGAMYAIAKAKLTANVYAVVAACENLISGSAYKTGDIIESMSGKTIEVLNTDAEGRLTLADALYYTATKIKPNAIIDFATLTGACVVALGEVYTGALTNNNPLYEKVLEAAKLSGEKVWLLPNDEEFKNNIKSKVADLSNIGVRGAGCITAGAFLENFVENIPWVHMDIAGTAFTSAPIGYLPTGGTGIHVKTLFNLVKNNDYSTK